MPIQATCAHCGKQFNKSRPDGGREKHCSIYCRWASKVSVPADVNACWNWVGTLANNGYGVLRINNKTKTSHRLSLVLHGQEEKDGMSVLHSCDNRNCVNPLHLRYGTQADNNKDIMERKRHAWNRWTDEEKKQWVTNIVSSQKRPQLRQS